MNEGDRIKYGPVVRSRSGGGGWIREMYESTTAFVLLLLQLSSEHTGVDYILL